MIFSRSTQAYNAATDTPSPTPTTISGEGVIVRGDPSRYQALNLIESQAPTILFTPSGYPLRAFTAEFVMPGDTVPINGVVMTVRDVSVTAPDGFVVVSRIIVSI